MTGGDLAALTRRPSRHMQILHSCIGGRSAVTRPPPHQECGRDPRGCEGGSAIRGPPSKTRGAEGVLCTELRTTQEGRGISGSRSLVVARELPTPRRPNRHSLVPGDPQGSHDEHRRVRLSAGHLHNY